MFTFGEIAFTFGEITFAFGDSRRFRVLEISCFCCWRGLGLCGSGGPEGVSKISHRPETKKTTSPRAF